MASPEALSATGSEVTFRSGDAECAGVFFRPETTEAVPCAVIAHGFGALKEGGPIRVAERYAQAGFAALAFDYRHFGASGGERRQLIDIDRQLNDWRAAIAFARTQEGVDPERIALWGTSFSGGHVFVLGAEDPAIAAIVSQTPHVSGVKTLNGLGPANNMRLTVAALKDLANAAVGRGPATIPIVGPPGTTAAMNTPDALPGYHAMYDEGFVSRDDFVPRVALKMPLYRPGARAGYVRCPILVQVASNDAVTPPGPAMDAAQKAPKGELITYAGIGHFDIYRGEPFERAVADQIEFLSRHLTAPE